MTKFERGKYKPQIRKLMYARTIRNFGFESLSVCTDNHCCFVLSFHINEKKEIVQTTEQFGNHKLLRPPHNSDFDSSLIQKQEHHK